MSTLLHIDSTPLYGRSVSRELSDAFVTQWKASHPDGAVINRDLNATAIPPINAEWVGAVYTPEQDRTPQQKELLSLSDSLLAELELELQPQGKHDLPLQGCTTEGCVENTSAALTIHAVEGKIKVHLVEDIEDVCPKLNRGIFS